MEPENPERQDGMTGASPEANDANVGVKEKVVETVSANGAVEAVAETANVNVAPATPSNPATVSVTPATPSTPTSTASGNNPAMTEQGNVSNTPMTAGQSGAPNTPATHHAHGEKVNFLQTILQIFYKPFTVLHDFLPKFNNPKNAGILTGIVLVASVLLSTIARLFNVVFSFYCTSGSNKTCKADLDFDLLKYWKFGDFLFENIASTVVIMLVIAGAFFGIAKLLKSQKTNFWRVLSVVSLSALPIIATSFISSFVGEFQAMIAIYIVLIGMLYALIIFYEGVTVDAELKGDKKAYQVFLAAIAACVIISVLAWLIGDKIGLVSFTKLLSL